MTIKIVNLFAFLVMVLMNYLANALPINGKSTGELSAQYPNLFVPAGLTFSIWGVIYLLLLIFVVIQFFDSQRAVITSIGLFFAASSVLNSMWILAWHHEKLALSILVMFLLLFTLIMINLKLPGSAGIIPRAAFGIYLGWISIATIANVTAYLVAINWQGWGLSDQTWAVAMILAGCAITTFLLIANRNIYTGLAVIWAISGIIIARWPDNRAIIVAAFVSIALITAISLVISIRPHTT